jgi:hypothetical protein
MPNCTRSLMLPDLSCQRWSIMNGLGPPNVMILKKILRVCALLMMLW